MQLSLSQQFEVESIKRSIDEANDFEQLKGLARDLADLYILRGLLRPGSSQSANDSNRIFCLIPLPGLFQIGAE